MNIDDRAFDPRAIQMLAALMVRRSREPVKEDGS